MIVDGVRYRSIRLADDGWSVEVIDQTRIPHGLVVRKLASVRDAAEAIRTMIVRGAPLIGATAAYGLCLQAHEDASDEGMAAGRRLLSSTRPTAVNLERALDHMWAGVMTESSRDRAHVAYARAAAMCDEDVACCEAIGRNGLGLLEDVRKAKSGGAPVQVLTHCNAGWLAAVDWGTALAPVYRAHDEGMEVHVWVTETRPRNQGSSLTAWELGKHGVPYTVVADNASGHLMQRGRVDLCITGSDRVLVSGDVCNKVGTYLKALAARESGVPFYVALPESSIDWSLEDAACIPIEERAPAEVTHIVGQTADGTLTEVLLTPEGAPAANFAFDVTPSRLVTGLVTERGICEASREGLFGLYPERQP